MAIKNFLKEFMMEIRFDLEEIVDGIKSARRNFSNMGPAQKAAYIFAMLTPPAYVMVLPGCGDGNGGNGGNYSGGGNEQTQVNQIVDNSGYNSSVDCDEEECITVCHKPGTPAEQTSTIPLPALEGHLGHGDYLGDCEEIGECNDGIDNDGNTLTDYPEDYGCNSSTDSSESFQQIDIPRTDLNSGNNDARVFITPSGLRVYFTSDRKTGYGWDFYTATRPDTSSSFNAPTLLSTLSTDDPFEGGIWVSDDGLRAYISRQPDFNRIFTVSRPDITDSFGTATELPELRWDNSSSPVSPLPDELTVFFVNNGSGSMGAGDLYMATRPSIDSPFDTIVNVSELNTSSGDGDHCISRDGLTMFFSSSRSPNLGGGDMWYSSRPDLSSPWDAPVKVLELSTPRQEGLGQGCINHSEEIYYHRDVGGNRLQIFYAVR